MGMITGCPACGTLFKVVPDQLKVSDGWVRCGHCSEIFDASSRLQDADEALASVTVPPPASPPASPTAFPSPAPAWTPPPPVRSTQAPSASPVDRGWKDSPPEPADWAHDVVSLDLDTPGPSAPALGPVPEDPLTTVPASHEAGDYQREVEALRSAAVAEPADALADDLGPAASADVSFVRQARRRAFWRRPWVRALLVLLLLGLAALLAAQVGLQQRERLVAQWPQLRPVLASLCEVQGCRIGPWRQIDALVIDSSGFTRLRAETYRLTVVLNNQAALPVAMPHMELTLTDTQDQALVRRVLAPRDLGASADTLAAGAEWNGAATLSVAVPASVGRVAGYRLLAFYP